MKMKKWIKKDTVTTGLSLCFGRLRVFLFMLIYPHVMGRQKEA